ncbi:probable ADP-ribosylation factor GTPase-activating protein AGD14 isoform X2 [Actinidia eriantha]|nr:probable ADP-ribosylation factor GTPase-activating protein AGD14 isoform X2 [Actinidia eriantha]XP_057506173.1 probable ADP-ribosylation factor GTPase-activating protein AGD14 isoform X2 [Actinidia eriantha]XP_057506174.1 probable ADP-ribosylation factor GTPase-activating protein AGD14 isoform X2 [Actinidia eriantha]XP_057506175.1 probable ADP-ribosylation factor GTPase-activating protein AGD14 isoform X2 [Actinidia eriantha]XP_057506176.1 probable ADP-ribosylation factor GTPase-activating p
MANRAKEDEKNEKTIRNLLKLPDNRRCINCNSLGPQYVCTNFWIFVCTTCSGIHREFTHRVKSVSMAKFTSQEVSALQGGGNASAKEIYFKEWDPQRHSFPDSSNVERLRDFIKHVYVDRRYTGERSFDKPPRVKMGEAEDSYENRRDTYRAGSRSPPYEDTYERRYSERPSPGGRSDDRNYKNTYDERRSPGYDQESRQYGDYRRSPARAEIVNDWRREDRFGSGKRSDDGRISDASSQLEGKSPNRQKDLDVSSPPIVRPVRDILGDNVTPLRIIEPPKANGGRVTDGSLRTQRTASSSSLASSNGNPAESKRVDIGTLIDFDAVPEPPTIATVLPPQQTVAGQSVVQPTISSNADNWACFDSPTVVKVTEAPSNANLMGLVLSELSVPAYVPVQTAGIPGTGGFPTTVPSGNSFGAPPVGMSILSFGSNVPVAAPGNNLTMFPPVSAQGGAPVGHTIMSPFGVGAPAAATTKNLTAFPSGGTPAAAPGLTTAFPSNGGQWPTMLPQQPSLFPATGFQHAAHTFTPPGSEPSSYQPRNFSIAPNTQGPPSIPSAQTSQAVSKQPSPPEVKPSGGKELPEDLFAPTYPSSAPYPGWQTGPPQGYGFNMQFNPAVSMQMFPHSSQSTNPFDVNSEVSSVHAPTFPSMASLQGALPNMSAPAGLLRTSSLGTPTPTWMPSQSNYPLAMPPQAPSFASAMPPGAYMGQQLPNNLPPRQQAVAGAFGPPNLNQQHQQLGGIYSAPATPNLYSAAGGNPFG